MSLFVIIVSGIVILGVLAVIFSINQKAPENNETKVNSGGCCGQHITCEKDSLLSAVSPNIEYYDDEELDIFKGVASDQYSEEEIDQFREVLETLQDDDVAGWVRSLQNRGINIPIEIKDEVFLRVGENRVHRMEA